MKSQGNLKHLAITGLIWSLAQKWGERLITIAVFIILARLLSPEELGAASAAMIVVGFISVISQQGFGNAIVQRPALEHSDINLPFFAALLIAFSMAMGGYFAAPLIETWMNVPGLMPVIKAASFLPILSTASMFQFALYRRNLNYRTLTICSLWSNSISGAAAVYAAYSGLGVWSLIIQSLVTNVVSGLWVWIRPIWRPSLHCNFASFKRILSFSLNTLGTNVLNFCTVRVIEVIIVTLHGPAALALYAVGARIYQALMQAVNSVVLDVGLSTLSKMTEDPERFRQNYLRGITATAFIVMPVFVAISSVSQELCGVLFGEQWRGSAEIAGMLSILGAVQSVQFFNGVCFSALGKPHYILKLNIVRLALAVGFMSLIPSENITELTRLFLYSQLLYSPLVFAVAVRLIKVRCVELLKRIAPFASATALAYCMVGLIRPILQLQINYEMLLLSVLLCCFVMIYGVLAFAMGFSRARSVCRIVLVRSG